MGLATDRLHSAMRFSLSSLLEEKDIDEACKHISKSVNELRLGICRGDLPETEPDFLSATL